MTNCVYKAGKQTSTHAWHQALKLIQPVSYQALKLETIKLPAKITGEYLGNLEVK
jgi:hypothetical protein